MFSIFLSNHRTDLALTGTKLGCGEGGCGACTVMLSTIHDRPAWESELPGLEAVGGQAVVAAAAGPPSPPTHTPPTTTHRAVNACLMPLYSAEGTHVVTVEGLGSVADGLHPVQAALADAHGSQCGFCTPGFVMSVHALLRRRAAAAAAAGAPAALSPHDLEDALAGNLCRCTGYRPILDALNAVVGCGALAAAYAGGAATAGGGGGGCCSRGGKEGGKAACPFAGLPRASCGVRAASGGCAPAAATATTAPPPGAEPVFPPALRRRALRPLALPGLITAWHRPLTLKAVADLLADTGAMMKKDQGAPFPPTRLVVGGTEVMVEARQRGPAAVPATLIDVSHVPALAAIGPAPGGAGLAIGAAASLGRLGEALTQLREAPPGVLPGSGALAFAAAVLDQLRWFAGAQVKAVATLGGNAATASPISDLNPLWVAFGAAFDLFRADPAAPGGVSLRSVPAASFFTGYRSTALRPGEAILRLNLPWPRTGPGTRTFARSFKQARRKEDDIAIVTAGMAVVFERATPQKSDAGGPGGSVSPRWVATHVSLAFGGVADRTVAAPAAAAALTGKDWADPASLAAGLAALGASDISIPPDAPGGMAAYRRALASGFLARFVAWAAVRLAGEEGEGRARPPPHALASLAEEWGDRPPLRGLQAWDGSDDPAAPPPTKHAAADLHVSGEATYAADVPCPAGTLHAAFITSTRAHAPLVGLDTAPALALPGVVAVVSAADVVSNAIGPACGDPVFAEGAVTHVGQPVGLVLASTEHAARAGAAAARVAYGPDSPGAVFTIEDALAAGSVFPATVDRCVRAGLGSEPASDEASLDAIFAAVAAAGGAVVAGTARIGGQEHFYLEPFGALATPVDGGRELHVLSSTQAPHHVQADIVRATGLPASRVVVKTKRLGGGFGGRETRASLVAAAAAVAAAVVRVPVRLILDRYIDMQISGQRHPFLITYRAAAHADGRLAAADVRLASNGGCSPDLSPAVMDRALLHADGCYAWPVFRARGVVARTNLPSNTAFRGFGGPQGLFGAEVMVTHLAAALGRAPEDVRAANLYSEGDPIPCGQALTECRLGAVWEEATSGRAGRGKVVEGGGGGGAPPAPPPPSTLAHRRASADAWNATHPHLKRGVAAIPTRFGIAFTFTPLNQAGALVHIYADDGSVLVSHGGVEMGQGLHTKVVAIAAAALGVPADTIHISETATDKVANASPTAASASTDLYGGATADACRTLAARLAPYRARLGGGAPMAAVAAAAWADRVDLTAHGFHTTPGLTPFSGDGRSPATPFHYFAYGAAVVDAEVDCLTGATRLTRADLCMDVGAPIAPALDVGQVEGAFVQGLGWALMEDLVRGDPAHPWVKPAGALFSRGPGAYKLPSAGDAPPDLRVSLLRGVPCGATAATVHSSKAVGEPPLALGLASWFAVRDAVAAARADPARQAGGGGGGGGAASGWFEMQLPATAEAVRLAVGGDAVTEGSGLALVGAVPGLSL